MRKFEEFTEEKDQSVNELKQDGRIVKIEDDEYTIRPHRGWKVEDIVAEFKDNGFEVSEEAIMHNYNAWCQDFKSGYRDKTTYLFTPCGCNPLRFTASKIKGEPLYWQHTYEA